MGIGLTAALSIGEDSGQLLPDNKSSEHGGSGVTALNGVLALAEKHRSLARSIFKGHGALKHLQDIWPGTTHPVCSSFCHYYF